MISIRAMLLGFVSFIYTGTLYSQNPTAPSNLPYSRNSISVVFGLFSDQSESEYMSFLDSLDVPEKFDHNIVPHILRIPTPLVGPYSKERSELFNQLATLRANPKPDKSTLERISYLSSQVKELDGKVAEEDSLRAIAVQRALYDNRVANKSLASVLIDYSKGSMTRDILSQRGLYNASDNDYLTAMSSNDGEMALMTAGFGLLKNTYIMLFLPSGMSTSAESSEPEAKTYSISGSVNLYKVRVDSLMETGEFQSMVFLNRDPVKLQKFENYQFPLKYITSATFSGAGKNFTVDAKGTLKGIGKSLLKGAVGESTANEKVVAYKFRSDTLAYVDLINSSISSADFSLTRVYDPFKIKVQVFSNSPIAMKIGKKESLRKDHLYFVTEKVLGGDGKPYDKKVGWVRARKISDNRFQAKGQTEPSLFYKVGSKSVRKGMTAKYTPELGIILGAGYNVGGVKNDITQGPFFSVDYITGVMPGLRLSLNAAFGSHVAYGSSKGGDANLYFGDAGDLLQYDLLDVDSDNLKGFKVYTDLTAQKILQLNRLELTPMLGAFLAYQGYSKVQLGGSGDWVTLAEGYSQSFQENETLSAMNIGVLAGGRFGINFGKHTQLYAGIKYLVGTNWSKLTSSENSDQPYFNNGWWYSKSEMGMKPFVGLRIIGF